MPDEMLVILAAEKFGLLPNEVEERMTPRWWDLWLCYLQEQNRG